MVFQVTLWEFAEESDDKLCNLCLCKFTGNTAYSDSDISDLNGYIRQN